MHGKLKAQWLTQPIALENEEHFMHKTAEAVEEAKQLVEEGFEYVTDIEDKELFRKHK